jgi:hypothetical protein
VSLASGDLEEVEAVYRESKLNVALADCPGRN